jgi:hypothetical protein
VFRRRLQVGEFGVVFPCGDENVSSGYGHDVEECEYERGGEDQVALWRDEVGVGVAGDGRGGGGLVRGADFAKGAVYGVVVVDRRHGSRFGGCCRMGRLIAGIDY